MEYIDTSKCPNCGGPADNGHDRCYPPNPYFCTKCEGKEFSDVESILDGNEELQRVLDTLDKYDKGEIDIDVSKIEEKLSEIKNEPNGS